MDRLLLALVLHVAPVLSTRHTPVQVLGAVGEPVFLTVNLPPGFRVREAIWRSLTPAEELLVTSFKDDTEMRYKSRFSNRTRLHHNLTLEICPVRLGDDGTLSVLLVNTAGEMEQQVFQLEVYDVVTTPAVQIFAHSSNRTVHPCIFFLTCAASHGSNVTYRWTRPDGTALARDKHSVFDRNRVLWAELDLVEDMHLSYTCTASNAVSRKSVTVDVQKICQTDTGGERSAQTLQPCSSERYPSPFGLLSKGTKDSAYDYRNILLIVVPLSSFFLATGTVLIMHTKQKSGKMKSYDVSESELA